MTRSPSSSVPGSRRFRNAKCASHYQAVWPQTWTTIARSTRVPTARRSSCPPSSRAYSSSSWPAPGPFSAIGEGISRPRVLVPRGRFTGTIPNHSIAEDENRRMRLLAAIQPPDATQPIVECLEPPTRPTHRSHVLRRRSPDRVHRVQAVHPVEEDGEPAECVDPRAKSCSGRALKPSVPPIAPGSSSPSRPRHGPRAGPRPRPGPAPDQDSPGRRPRRAGHRDPRR